MKLFVFPMAFMANTFSMMLVMIGLSFFGEPAMAANFGLVHGATVALFYAFSGNARSLILSESNSLDGATILRFRFILVIPLAFLSFFLVFGVVEGVDWVFILLLIFRRAVEWLVEIFLTQQEQEQRTSSILVYLVGQCFCCLFFLWVLIEGGSFVLPVMLLWALSPAFGSVDLGFIKRSFFYARSLSSVISKILPHFGSTLVIGLSVYVFRLFIVLLVGEEAAGDLFAAFALGGILGSVYTQALGPTLVKSELRSESRGVIYYSFKFVMLLTFLIGGGLVYFVFNFPDYLAWTNKNDLFWLAVGCSLVGGGVMVQAQRIRLRVLQSDEGSDVFGSDVLANILLLACVPFLFYWLGVDSLVLLYLLGAFISLGFYYGESIRLSNGFLTRIVSGRFFPFVLCFFILFPVFFQLKNGLFIDPRVYFNSEGYLSVLPLPVSVIFCYLGVFLLGWYGRVKFSLIFVFSIFVISIFGTIVNGLDGYKMLLLMQYLLPFFAMVLGQQFSRCRKSLGILACSSFSVIALVVPLQLYMTLKFGFGFVLPSAVFFSVYQHLQYVPVIFVSLYFLAAFTIRGKLSVALILFGIVMGFYTFLTLSMAAIGFLFLAAFAFVVHSFCRRVFFKPVALLAMISLGVGGGYLYASDSALFKGKFTMSTTSAELLGQAIQSGRAQLVEENLIYVEKDESKVVMPKNMLERVGHWKYYVSEVFDGWSDFFWGHDTPPERHKYPSAHNYYLDFLYNFGLFSLLPVVFLLIYFLVSGFLSLKVLWRFPPLLGVFGVVLFLLFVENFLKVGMRQPYAGIVTFFLLGILVGYFERIRLNRAV